MRPFLRLGVVAGATWLALGAAAPATSAEAPLADAAMKRDTARVRALLKQGADVNAAQGDGMTALHWAAQHGFADQARMLVFAGARLDAITRNGSYTPLHLAARSGRATVVAALLDAGANVNQPTSSGGASPLHLAVQQGDPGTIKALLDKGASVDAPEGAWKQTPLMWAAAYNRTKAIELLLARGASVKQLSLVENTKAREATDRTSMTSRARRVAALKQAERPQAAVGAAAAPGFERPGATTVVARPDSAARRDSMPARLPRPSVDSGRAVAVRQDSGRSLAARPDSGVRARPAADTSNTGAVRPLGYTDLLGNRGGLAPLHFAARDGNTEAALMLLDAGAEINLRTGGDSSTALLLASINGHFDLAKALLTRGADPKIANHAGATPLYTALNVQWAAKSMYPQPTAQKQQQTTYLQLMEDLIEAGADVNARLTKHLWFMSYNFDLLGVNTQGATPFWRAAYATDVPAMKLLVKHGADHKVATTKPAGRIRTEDAPSDDGTPGKDPSGLPPAPIGGPGVYPIHAASGAGYGEGFAANSHVHAPESWLASVKYLVEELGHDPNQRDMNGYNALHNAASRGDDELIDYLVAKGVDITAVSRKGETVADMANGPVQRIPPFVETVKKLEKLGSKNSNKCKSC
ncbi:MAG: ankyrin repeat domain-containing protein [Gemmatimonadetes bacterium]|nr:ankyrin repeat domain-containing protein [Gemmatimonadota bacterium]